MATLKQSSTEEAHSNDPDSARATPPPPSVITGDGDDDSTQDNDEQTESKEKSNESTAPKYDTSKYSKETVKMSQLAADTKIYVDEDDPEQRYIIVKNPKAQAMIERVLKQTMTSQSMSAYFRETLRDDLHVYIPALTEIFANYGGVTIDDIRARVVSSECFTETIHGLKDLVRAVKTLRDIYNTVKPKKKQIYKVPGDESHAKWSEIYDEQTNDGKSSKNKTKHKDKKRNLKENNEEKDNEKGNGIKQSSLTAPDTDYDSDASTKAVFESMDKRSEEYKEATQGNQYIKPGDRVYLTRVEGSAGHKKECEVIMKKYLVSMGLHGIVGTKLFDLMYEYKVYEPLHLRSKLTPEEFDDMYNEAMNSASIPLVGRQPHYLEGTRYGWTKHEIDKSFKNKKRRGKRGSRRRTNTSSNDFGTSVLSPRAQAVGSPRGARVRSRSRAAHTSSTAIDTVFGSMEHKRACRQRMQKFLKEKEFIGLSDDAELFDLMYERYAVYEPDDLKLLSKQNVDKLIKQATTSSKFAFTFDQGRQLRNYCLGYTTSKSSSSTPRIMRKLTGRSKSIVFGGKKDSNRPKRRKEKSKSRVLTRNKDKDKNKDNKDKDKDEDMENKDNEDNEDNKEKKRKNKEKKKDKKDKKDKNKKLKKENSKKHVKNKKSKKNRDEDNDDNANENETENDNSKEDSKKSEEYDDDGNGDFDDDGDNGQDETEEDMMSPSEELCHFIETEASLGHIFCKVLSEILVNDYGVRGINDFHKRIKNDKKRKQFVNEAKKIHTTGGIANHRDFEKFLRRIK